MSSSYLAHFSASMKMPNGVFRLDGHVLPRSRIGILLSFLLQIAVGLTCSDLAADRVQLASGVELEGEVLENEEGKPLVFRYQTGGLWKTVSLSRDSIASLKIDPSDADDGHADHNPGTKSDLNDAAIPTETDLPPATIRTVRDMRQLLEKALPPRDPEKAEVVIVYLQGTFAPPNLQKIGSVISSAEVGMLLSVADHRNPEAIVLAIDSGGGDLFEMDKVIEHLLTIQSDPHNQRLIAWVDLGGSAAALTALACKEIVMRPTGRMGSATAIFANGEAVPDPEKASEQKLAAMRDARRRQIADLTKRPIELQYAMEMPRHQFWAHPRKGFSLTEQPEEDGWKSYDSDVEKPLALAANELVELRIADGTAGGIDELLSVLGLPQDIDVVGIDLASQAMQALIAPAQVKSLAEHNKAIEEELKLRKRIRQYADSISLAITAVRAVPDDYLVSDLASVRAAIGKCRTPMMTNKVRDMLKEWDPDRCIRYEIALKRSRELVDRASKATTVMRGLTLPVGRIEADLETALGLLLDSLGH